MSTSAIRRSLSAAALVLAAAPLRADTLKVPSQFESIQAAVDVAVAGDTVLVSKGTYSENVVVLTAGITLKGKSAIVNGGYTGDCILVQAADVAIEGFTLVNGGGAPLKSAPGDGTPTGGLHVTGTGASISKLTVSACEAYGIFLNGTGSVEKCTVDACNGDGIRVDTDDIMGQATTTISKNTVTRCDAGITAADGPFLIEKNTCELNESSGLSVSIPALEGFPAIQPTTVSKNEARYNDDDGLFVDKQSGPPLVVDKNICEHNDAGCEVSGFVLEITGNTFDDNNFGGLFVLATGCTVSKNKVRGNGDVGIFVGSGSIFDDGSTSDGSNVFVQDTVQDNGGDGIHIVSSSNSVDVCTFKDNLGDGVDVDDGASDNALTENKITGNTHDGIDNSGQLTLIIGNTSKDNGGADLAGAGDGTGTVDKASADNVVGDGSDFSTTGELELATIVF
jgi:parallel beta-helix repeat protein